MTDFKTLVKNYLSVPDTTQSRAQDDAARFIESRFFPMSNSKVQIRNIWQGTQALYYCNDWEWIVTGEDWNRPVRFPTLRDFTESLVDSYMDNPPDVTFRANDPDEQHLAIGKQAYLENVRNSIREKSIRRRVAKTMFFSGVGLRELCVIRDRYGHRQIGSRSIDPRNFFLDESAVRIHDEYKMDCARDCIVRNQLPYSSYLQYAREKGWTTGGVTPQAFYTQDAGDYWPTNQRELIEKSPVQVVKLYEYMNPGEDLYIVVAGTKTVFEGKLSEAKGVDRIPIADYQFEVRDDTFWGNNLATLLAPHIYMKDTLINLEKLNLQLTLQPVVAMSGNFGYNPRVHVMQPGGVWVAGGDLQGKIGDNIQPLIAGNPNTKVYEMFQLLQNELAITSRTDVLNLEEAKDKTATEVVAQNQLKNTHNETIESINEIESEAVFWQLAADAMTAFMEERNEDGEQIQVPIKGYEVEADGESEPKFTSKSGYEGIFRLTQKIIDTDVKVEVQDKRTQVAHDIEKMGRIMQAVPLILNIAKLNPADAGKIDTLGLIDQVIESVGMDQERSFLDYEQAQDQFELAKEEILLAHNIDVDPDETRQESLSRLRYFLNFRNKKGKALRPDQVKALHYHLDSTVKNITSNKLAQVQQEEQEQEQAESGQPHPGMAPANMQMAQKVQQINQQQQQLQQPNPQVLNTAKSPANLLKPS